MFNPNNTNSTENGREYDPESEPITENIDQKEPDKELNKKLGHVANTRASNEELWHEEREGYIHPNVLRADDEISYKMNLEHLENYLKDIGIDSKMARTLLASGIFDAIGESADYRVSIWNEKTEDGEPYLRSTTKDRMGHRKPSGHVYKVFEWGGSPLIYDSGVKEEYVCPKWDFMAGDIEPFLRRTNFDRAFLIEPNTGKIIAVGERPKTFSATDKPVKYPVMNVHNENLEETLGEFEFRIVDREKVKSFLSSQGRI